MHVPKVSTTALKWYFLIKNLEQKSTNFQNFEKQKYYPRCQISETLPRETLIRAVTKSHLYHTFVKMSRSTVDVGLPDGANRNVWIRFHRSKATKRPCPHVRIYTQLSPGQVECAFSTQTQTARHISPNGIVPFEPVGRSPQTG